MVLYGLRYRTCGPIFKAYFPKVVFISNAARDSLTAQLLQPEDGDRGMQSCTTPPHVTPMALSQF